MAVFMIVPTVHEPSQLKARLIDMFAGHFHELPKGEFLVKYTGTSRQLSDDLGITDGTNGAAVVASLGGYYGRAPNDVWEWIKQNWGDA